MALALSLVYMFATLRGLIANAITCFYCRMDFRRRLPTLCTLNLVILAETTNLWLKLRVPRAPQKPSLPIKPCRFGPNLSAKHHRFSGPGSSMKPSRSQPNRGRHWDCRGDHIAKLWPATLSSRNQQGMWAPKPWLLISDTWIFDR